MRFLYQLALLSFLGSSYLPAAEAARRIIGFEHPHLVSNAKAVNHRPGLLEQGFRLSTPGDGVYVQNALYDFSPDNGGRYARFIYGAEGLTVVHRDGLPFTPHQVDLAEHGNSSITFVGTKADSTTVSVTFTLDGVFDGRGPQQDFQTFNFPASFAEIVKLQVQGTLYYLDNLHVTPHGVESAEPAPPAAPLVYDIDWNEAPHEVNAPMSVGGPRAASSSVFGTQYVRNQIGDLRDRPLELATQEDIYDQIELACGLNASRYVLEFDITFPDGGDIAVFLDHTQGFFRTEVGDHVGFLNYSDGSIVSGPSIPLPAANARSVMHWRFDMDIGGGKLRAFVNGQQACEFNIPNKTLDLSAIRFSAGSTCGLDNVKVSAYATNPVTASTNVLSFGTLEVGTSARRTVRLSNSSAQPVTLQGVVETPDAFRVVESFPLTLPADGHVDLTVEATALVEGRISHNLNIETSAGLVGVGLQVEGLTPVAAAEVAGSYEGLVGEYIQDLGPESGRGSFSLTVTAAGSLSGNAKIAGKTYPIKGALEDESSVRPTARVQIGLKGKTVERTFEFTAAGQVFSQAGFGLENRAFTGAKVVGKEDAAPFAGLFPTAFLHTEAQAAQPPLSRYNQVPLGAGFLHLRLGKNGIATFTGRTADGSALTGSSKIVLDWTSPSQIRVPVHILPLGRWNHFNGWLISDGENVDGNFTWNKSPSTKYDAYQQGFGPQSLIAIGSRHTAPGRNEVLMDLDDSSWLMSFKGKDYSHEQPKQLTVNARHKASVSGPGLPAGVTLTIAPATSSFSGSFVSEKFRNIPVKGFFHGIFVPRLGQGVGFYTKANVAYFFQKRPQNPNVTPLSPLETGGVYIFQPEER